MVHDNPSENEPTNALSIDDIDENGYLISNVEQDNGSDRPYNVHVSHRWDEEGQIDGNIVGKVFDTPDDAYTFYNQYGFTHGFGIHKHWDYKNKLTNEVYRKWYVCNKEGFKSLKDVGTSVDPEVVAEAFSSIDDPLLIKSKEKIMSILFPRKNTHKVHMSLNNVNTGTILDVSSSETLPDTNIMNRVDLQMNWNVAEEISKAIKKKGVALNKLSAATMIKNEVDINKGKLLIAVAAQISCSYEDASLLTYAIEQLKLLAFAFNTSRIELEHSGVWKSVSLAVKGLQRERRKIDNFLKRSFMIQASKVEQTGDDDSVLLENQSDCGNT